MFIFARRCETAYEYYHNRNALSSVLQKKMKKRFPDKSIPRKSRRSYRLFIGITDYLFADESVTIAHIQSRHTDISRLCVPVYIIGLPDAANTSCVSMARL